MRITKEQTRELSDRIDNERARIVCYFCDNHGMSDAELSRYSYDERLDSTIYGLVEGGGNTVSEYLDELGVFSGWYESDTTPEDVKHVQDTLEQCVDAICADIDHVDQINTARTVGIAQECKRLLHSWKWTIKDMTHYVDYGNAYCSFTVHKENETVTFTVDSCIASGLNEFGDIPNVVQDLCDALNIGHALTI